MHNTSTMHLIYQNSEGQQFSQHWRDLTEMGTLDDPETGEDLELIGWHSDTAAATEVEVQAAWHAGLDEGREQGKGNEHCQAEPQPVAWQFQDRDGRWHGFVDEQHRQNTIADGSWPIRALYTAPPSVPVGVRGLPRYGFPDGNEPHPVPCTDGYWTPWHLAQALRNEALATAAKDVEIEELRADLADYMHIANTEATRAERLAEALLDVREFICALSVCNTERTS